MKKCIFLDDSMLTWCCRQTNEDGRCTTLLDASTKLSAGIYRMTFETGPYFAKDNRPTFYPRVEVSYRV